jgi:hypothetical protein
MISGDEPGGKENASAKMKAFGAKKKAGKR